MEPAGVLNYFTENSQDLIELVSDLARFDTPTGDANASIQFIRHYQKLLEEGGVSCRNYVTAAGVHLAGEWPAEKATRSRKAEVTFIVHSDTVWPLGEAARRPPALRDGKLYGPGVYDMRAGLALAVAFFRFLRDRKVETTQKFAIFVSCDEEEGSADAHQYMDREIHRDTVALVLEPPLPDGGLKIFRKGAGIYTLEISGRAAHAGTEPELGVSAIDELAHQILALHTLRNPELGITINIGEVQGGTAPNVIADCVRASIDLRFERIADGEELDQKIRALAAANHRTSLKVTGGIVYPPMVPTRATHLLAEKAKAMAAQLGISLTAGKSGGGSDGSYLSSKGIRTLDGLGVDGGGAHSLDEHIRVDRLPLRAALLSLLALELG